ncbi:very short patch repair endonuclease [Agromyces sp. NPDC004153]
MSAAEPNDRRRNMQANRRRDTAPERALRSLLFAEGFRYRCDFRVDLEGVRARPDIAFPRAKVAIFVDGCFWHGCPEHFTEPRRNTDYWRPKLERNRARDRAQTVALETAGWRVIRVWEHVAPQTALGIVSDVLALAYRERTASVGGGHHARQARDLTYARARRAN